MKKISGNSPLSEADPELYGLIKQEKNRQRSCLELIASENFTSKAVMDAVSFHLYFYHNSSIWLQGILSNFSFLTVHVEPIFRRVHVWRTSTVKDCQMPVTMVETSTLTR